MTTPSITDAQLKWYRGEIDAGRHADVDDDDLAELDAFIAANPHLHEMFPEVIQPAPEMSMAGAPEAIMAMGTGGLAEVASGYAGMLGAALPGEEGQGARWQQATQDAMTYQPRGQAGQETMQAIGESAPVQWLGEKMGQAEQYAGDVVFDATGSPTAAAIAEGVPAAATEAIPGYIGMRSTRAAGRGIGSAVSDFVDEHAPLGDVFNPENIRVEPEMGDIIDQEVDTRRRPEDGFSGDIPDFDLNVETATELTEKAMDVEGQRRKKNRVKAMEDASTFVDADPDLIQLYAEEGLLDNLLPAYVSQDPLFQQWNAAVVSSGGKQKMKHEAMWDELMSRGDSLMRELGGTDALDHVNMTIRNQFVDTDLRLKNESKTHYDKIDKAVPKGTVVNVPAVRDYVNAKLKGHGFDGSKRSYIEARKQLDPADKDLLDLSRKKNITYGDIDALRKKVGSKMTNTNHAIYDTSDADVLKDVYKALSGDQHNFLNAEGLGDTWREAKKIHTQRAKMAEAGKALFGKDLEKTSVVNKLTSNTKNLTKGDLAQFNASVNKIPKEFRGEAVSTAFFNAMNRKGKFSMAEFTSWWENMRSMPESREALFKHLPPGAEAKMARYYKLVKPWDDMQKSLTQTGKLVEVNKAFENVENAYGNVFTEAGKEAGATAAGVGATAAGGPAAAVGVRLMVKAALNKTTSKPKQAADNMISEKAFTDMLMSGSKGDEILARKQAQRLSKTKAFREWWKTVNPETKQRINDVGLYSFLIAPVGATTIGAIPDGDLR